MYSTMTVQFRSTFSVLRRIHSLYNATILGPISSYSILSSTPENASESVKVHIFGQRRLKSTSGKDGSGSFSGNDPNKNLMCPHCGEGFLTDQELRLSRTVQCSNCNHIFLTTTERHKVEPKKEKKQEKQRPIPYPKQIEEFASKYVIGQKLAKQQLSVAVYNHYKRLNNNLGTLSALQRAQEEDNDDDDYDDDGFAMNARKFNKKLTPPETTKKSSKVILPNPYEKELIAKAIRKRNIINVAKCKGTGISNSDFLFNPELQGHRVLRNLNKSDLRMLTSPMRYTEESPVTPDPKRVTKLLDGKDENKVLLDKVNVIMLGPTGSGKTFLLETMAKILEVPFVIVDCTSLTAAGYVGEDIESVVGKLLHACNGNVEKAQQGIVLLDEIDKLRRSRSPGGNFRDVGGEGVQQGLLKIVEGTVVNVPKDSGRKMSGRETVAIDTSNILFVGAGAFTGIDNIISKRVEEEKQIGFGPKILPDGQRMAGDSWREVSKTEEKTKQIYKKDKLLTQVESEDLVKYGFIPEFVGRFPVSVSFKHLTGGELVQILTNPRNGKVTKAKKSFFMDNIHLEFTDEALEALALKALSKDTGARGLESILQKVLQTAQFEAPGSDIIHVIVTKEAVEGKEDCEYIRKSTKEPCEAVN